MGKNSLNRKLALSKNKLTSLKLFLKYLEISWVELGTVSSSALIIWRENSEQVQIFLSWQKNLVLDKNRTLIWLYFFSVKNFTRGKHFRSCALMHLHKSSIIGGPPSILSNVVCVKTLLAIESCKFSGQFSSSRQKEYHFHTKMKYFHSNLSELWAIHKRFLSLIYFIASVKPKVNTVNGFVTKIRFQLNQ